MAREVTTEPPEVEDEILAAFRNGRPETVAMVRGWVMRVVTYPGWRFGDAESIAQDVLVKLLEIARSGRFRQTSSFRTFATSVARHTCIDAYRKQRWREQAERLHAVDTESSAASGEPDVHHEARERRELLRYVFQLLPEECRRLWVWIYGQGLAARQVAERAGISETNARVRAHRCLQRARGIARDYLAREA
ncbi:MAG: RNA polymerase sigma factor [Candidatus Polarisedimenticolia bacterium]